MRAITLMAAAALGVGLLSTVDSSAEPGPLSAVDRADIARAERAGEKAVAVMLSTEPGRTGALSDAVRSVGGDVPVAYDDLGYLRATLRPDQVERIAARDDVLAVDLNKRIAVSPLAPVDALAAPGPNTPEDNPYLPTRDIGAVALRGLDPRFDGRGTTILVGDGGVDLDHPATKTTSTGERKVIGWKVLTDPVFDGDPSWLRMDNRVTGPRFTYLDRAWTAPAGTYSIRVFAEKAAGFAAGDLNRDGDTTDVFGILYDPASHEVRVDDDQDGDFTDNPPMRPYDESFQFGHFGADRPETPELDQIPYTVDYREDLKDADGVASDYVNLGIVDGSHGSAVTGVAAGNDLFGGHADGVAPGARVYSARVCWNGCTAAALNDGLARVIRAGGIDVVNLSLGGLPALNDGSCTSCRLYDELSKRYGVQFVIAGGNDGPVSNTVIDAGTASRALSVAASGTKETFRAIYGANLETPEFLYAFSARGPREDGGMQPSTAAPGITWTSVLSFQGGELPGHGAALGTSLSSPFVAGGVAQLLSAARATGLVVTPDQVRQAILSTGVQPAHTQPYESGSGRMDVVAAWKILRTGKAATGGYVIDAPVCTPLSADLATPGRGAGVYNRCPDGGRKATYKVKVTRTTGPSHPVRHTLTSTGDRFEFPREVVLPRDRPVEIPVVALPAPGMNSALIRVDDPSTAGVDAFIPVSVIRPATAGTTFTGTAEREQSVHHWVTIPEGTTALTVAVSTTTEKGQVRAALARPDGLPAGGTCNTNTGCAPTTTIPNPPPGVWEVVAIPPGFAPTLHVDYSISVTTTP